MHKTIHKRLFGLSAATCLSLSLMVDPVAAQSASQGNTTIFEGTQLTVFGTHTFLTGGSGIQPGIVRTLRSGSPGVLGFAAGTSYTGADDANHVDGYVSKNGAAAFVFPVGNGNKLRPIAISAPASVGVFKAAYWLGSPDNAANPAGAPFPTANRGTGVTDVSTKEFWDLDGAQPVNITLSWDAASDLNTLADGNIANLLVVGFNTTTDKWENLGRAGGTTGSLSTTGTITANGVTPDNYAAFTLGSDINLPVTLVAFDARKESTTAVLTWATTAETNSDRFEIERSANGKAWSKIGSVASRGESAVKVDYVFQDDSPLNGENLYRLRMVDKDETFAYSSIKNLEFNLGIAQLVYPNPARDVAYVRNADQVKSISLIDLNGKSVSHAGLTAGGTLKVDTLTPGMYVVKVVRHDGSVQSQKIVVVK
ncbi:hypothetical protein GCM10010967_32340 [Dyadobacter beijingensis]|uniref:Secretion system C-terminal sorting domain-containing protein n=1 Tax=Dyadobacter beijingensis TaxID=365489 RepID=A0ABQ2HZN7_9BACT|nr:T9SS type A sorting domain-containing protein [Dyadobacter beijingensis]GGM96289.1 hypothetical protein GCM10010967_32340 [Dyadobacter beijingensis]